MNTPISTPTPPAVPKPHKGDRSRKRPKDATCFIVEFPMECSPKQRKKARSRLNTATLFYNTCLREAYDRANQMRTDPRWQQAQTLPKIVDKKPNPVRKRLFREAQKAAGFTKFSLDTFATKTRVGFLAEQLYSQEAQNVARQAYRAVEQWVFGKRGKPRYKTQARGLRSLETKGKTGSLQLHASVNKDGYPEFVLAWGRDYRVPLRVDLSNPVHAHGIQTALSQMLYARVVRRNQGRKNPLTNFLREIRYRMAV